MTTQYIEKRSTLVAVPNTETVRTSVIVNASARKAWKIVGDFSGFHNFIDGLSRIDMTGDGVRSVRKKFFEDGNSVLEQLNSIDNVSMVMTWSLIYTSLDINNLWSAMHVEEISENSCRVIWDIAGEPYVETTTKDDFDKFISDFAQGALANVKNILELKSKAA